MGKKTRSTTQDSADDSSFESMKRRQIALQKELIDQKRECSDFSLELSESTHAHATRFLDQVQAKDPPACQIGCAHCCHQPATAFPFEVIRIARFLRDKLSAEQMSDLRKKLESRVQPFKRASVKEQVNNKTPCPLLVDHQCSVYEHRPLTCRMAHSFSVKKCRQSFEKDRAQVKIPMSFELVAGISGVIEGVFEKLPTHHLDGNLYELSSVLLRALSDRSTEERWARGDQSAFKDCTRDDT